MTHRDGGQLRRGWRWWLRWAVFWFAVAAVAGGLVWLVLAYVQHAG